MAKPGRLQLFAYSRWDAVPALCAIFQAAYLAFLFWIFPHASWWLLIPMGLLYSIAISWNLNGVAHNFIHNPFFTSPTLNRLFSILESLVNLGSQVFYHCIHMRHHMGNSDRQDEHGQTIDWLSIYRHGHDGHAETPWNYVFLSFFRGDLGEVYREIHRKSPREAHWGIFEIGCTATLFLVLFILNWKFVLFFLPFFYLGNCLSYLNGYYKHFGGDPDTPIAWGVSTYSRLYNLIWFNNGYHAEHHYRPRIHWTHMKQLHEQIQEEMRKAGTRIIRPPHALGFLEPNLHERPPAAKLSQTS
jgi:fatty acid desaturase